MFRRLSRSYPNDNRKLHKQGEVIEFNLWLRYGEGLVEIITWGNSPRKLEKQGTHNEQQIKEKYRQRENQITCKERRKNNGDRRRLRIKHTRVETPHSIRIVLYKGI